VGSGYSVPGGGGRCRKEIMLDFEMSILTPSQSKDSDNPKAFGTLSRVLLLCLGLIAQLLCCLVQLVLQVCT
jgi:hypothetical protein